MSARARRRSRRARRGVDVCGSVRARRQCATVSIAVGARDGASSRGAGYFCARIFNVRATTRAARWIDARATERADSMRENLDRISITVVRDGTRRTIDGRVGETLASALARDSVLRDAAPVMSIARGPDAHVMIPDAFLEKMPALDALEVDKLEDVAEGLGKNSRLASQVTLTNDVDGLVCAIGRVYPENTM